MINAMGDALTGLLYGINIGWESASNCDIIKDMIQSLVFDDKYMGSREINRSDMPTGNLVLFLDRGYSDDDTLSYLRRLGIKYLATKKRNNLNPVGYAVKNPDKSQQIVDENGPRMFMKFEDKNCKETTRQFAVYVVGRNGKCVLIEHTIADIVFVDNVWAIRPKLNLQDDQIAASLSIPQAPV